MMKKLMVLLAVCLLGTGAWAQKTAKISAVANGYNGKVIDFEFIDNPANNMQYPYRDGQQMEFEVELEEPSFLKINRWVWVMVCPGDEIDMKMHFEGNNCRLVEYQGTETAVLLNEAIQRGRQVRLADHYKTNPLAAVVTQVPADKYHEQTQRLWAEEQKILGEVKDKVDERAYNYVFAELEGMYLSNLAKYPYVVSDVAKKKIEECLPGDYWTVFDGFQPKSDRASLKSFSYLGWLIEYKDYMDRKAAHEAGKPYSFARPLDQVYEELAAFYEGDTRDAVLYAFFYAALSSQSDFDTIKRLTKDYFKKYNKNKQYKKELTEMQK